MSENSHRQGIFSNWKALERNLFILSAGGYFVWQLLGLTGLHDDNTDGHREAHAVRLGPEFRRDVRVVEMGVTAQFVGAGYRS